jgi:hypothetical protein
MIRLRLLGQAALTLAAPVIFGLVSLLIVGAALQAGTIAIDAHIYYRGAAAWIAGTSPWEAFNTSVNGDIAHFAGLPTTVVLLGPFTFLPEQAFVVLTLAVGAVAAVYTVRKLELPWWYLLFPPLLSSVMSGNPSTVIIALLVSSRPALQALGALVKVYAIVPPMLQLRWRTLAWAAGFTALTLLAVPLWVEYITRFPEITARLAAESHGGLSPLRTGPWAEVVTLVALAILWFRNREAASWMAVPAAWPSSEHHYATFAMPILKTRTWLAVFLAVAPGFVWVGVLLLLVEDVVRSRRARRTGVSAAGQAQVGPGAPGDPADQDAVVTQ